MKLCFSIIAAWLISLAGLNTAFAFTLPKVTPDKGSPYGFGNHYVYDNAGSNWNHERAYRPPGHRQHYSRWYYHYGDNPNSYKEHRTYPYRKHRYSSYNRYGDYPGLGARNKDHIYSRHTPGSKGYTQRKHIRLRDRIPSHGFNHTKSFRPLNRSR